MIVPVATQVPRVKLRDRVVAQLVEIIASRDLADGARLPSERELVSRLGVSRTVVREALNLLEARGLVRVEHGRGAIIRSDTAHVVRESLLTMLRVNAATLWDLHEIRKILEVEIAGLAAQRARQADFQKMRFAIERMRARIGFPEGYIDADVEFHNHLARATGNQVFLLMIEPIGQLLRASRQVSASRPGSARRALREHETILHAVSVGDVRRAQQAMRAHLQSTARDLEVVTGHSVTARTHQHRVARKGGRSR